MSLNADSSIHCVTLSNSSSDYFLMSNLELLWCLLWLNMTDIRELKKHNGWTVFLDTSSFPWIPNMILKWLSQNLATRPVSSNFSLMLLKCVILFWMLPKRKIVLRFILRFDVFFSTDKLYSIFWFCFGFHNR